MAGIIDKIRNEPAVVIGFVTAAIAVAVTLFDWSITDEGKAAIIGLVTAALAFVTRSQVSPVE